MTDTIDALIYVVQELTKERDALRHALKENLDSMASWGADEDGIPDEAFDWYERGRRLIGGEMTEETCEACEYREIEKAMHQVGHCYIFREPPETGTCSQWKEQARKGKEG